MPGSPDPVLLARLCDQVEAEVRARPEYNVDWLIDVYGRTSEVFDRHGQGFEIPAREQIEASLPKKIAHEVDKLLPFAVTVWEEGGGELPLSENQMATARIRASQVDCERLTEMMSARLDSLPPKRRTLARAMVDVFRRSNAQRKAFRNIEDITEEDLKRMAEATATDMQEAVARWRRGELNSDETNTEEDA